MQKQAAIVGVFDDHTKTQHLIDQLQQLGVSESQIHQETKTKGWDISHAVPDKKENPQEMKPDFSRYGLSAEESLRYEHAYEAGYTLLFVQPHDKTEIIIDLFKHNGAYNYQTRGAALPHAMGAMTPGMRGEDSTQIGVANSAGGEHAADIDQATIEADVAHAERVLQEKYQECKARGLE